MAEPIAAYPTPPDAGRGGLRLVLAVLGLALASIAYAVAAFMHPLLGRSFVAVAFLTLIFLTGSLLAIARWNRDPIDPLRLVSAFFVLVYCIAPLLRTELEWFFVGSVPDLLGQAAAFAFFGLLCIALGYYLPPFRPFPKVWTPRSDEAHNPLLSLYALALFGLGLLAYIALFVRAGGIEGIIASQENRVEFAKGAGYLLHASLFMYAGGALYFASKARPGSSRPWLWTWPLAIAFVLFLLLQNRSRVFQVVVILVVIWHYQIRPLRLRKLAPYGLALGALFIFVGFARDPNIRPLLLTAPGLVVQEAGARFGELAQQTLGFSLNRLQQAMLALDSYPHRAPHEWGLTLFAALNPVLRIMGLESLQRDSLGNQFFQLARPDVQMDVQTGYHPSLLGELLANFPWYLAPFGAIGYGIVLRALYTGLVVKRRDVVSIAAYSAILFRIADMVIVGVGQLVFQILVVVVPILVARPLSARPFATPGGTAPSELAEPAPDATWGSHAPEPADGGDPLAVVAARPRGGRGGE